MERPFPVSLQFSSALGGGCCCASPSKSTEGQAAWTAVPALGAPPPAASHPPAPRFPSPPLPASVTGRRRRGPRSGPDAGHQVCGGGRRVSARPCRGRRRGCRPRRRGGRAALGSPQARKASGWRRARARLSGGRGPPTLPGLVPASGWGRAWASRPEGKVNSTLLLSFPRTPPVALLSLARRRGWFENFCFFLYCF